MRHSKSEMLEELYFQLKLPKFNRALLTDFRIKNIWDSSITSVTCLLNEEEFQ